MNANKINCYGTILKDFINEKLNYRITLYNYHNKLVQVEKSKGTLLDIQILKEFPMWAKQQNELQRIVK